ncbi:hypothetical protein A4H97_29900 [Niastella yeongjuensis]|uniref:Iron dicitrate transport regulator FecR n=1 Tax=Niastella yeongjuensis TaxID=354355 RepID=A0A1V9EPP4_9BACT|nr:hypothetical protein A4H97_29900 [Niastella yeongjuensis]
MSAADRGTLEVWLNESPRNRVFLESLTNQDSLLERMKEYEQAKAMTGEAKATVHELIREENKAPVRSMSGPSRFWIPAAAMLIIAAGLYIWNNKKNTPGITVQQKSEAIVHDAAPGTYKAKLTLSDGSTIVLDSGGVGRLTQQGNTEVVNKNGGLAYAKGLGKAADAVYNTLTTAKGEIYRLQLSDGSKVWLNSASSVRYPVSFNGSARRVEITGEVYFEVAHLDHNQSFIVMANGIEIRVLGTHFNINAYSDEAAIKTTLLEGRVQVTPTGGKPVTLLPGQQAAVTGKIAELIEHADTEQAIAWKNGYFQFNEADLKTVMKEFGRWYDMEIVYEGKIPQPVFSGKLSRNANASEVLKVLEQNGIRFRIEGKKIIVTQ